MKKFLGIVTLLLASLMLVSCGKAKAKHVEIDFDEVKDECPYELSDDVVWSSYPSDNIIRLSAIAMDPGEKESTVVMVFNTKTPTDYDFAFHVIRSPENLQGYWGYGFFDLDECESEFVGKTFYVKGVYDSRIDIENITFIYNYRLVRINVLNQSVEFIDYLGDGTVSNTSQKFDIASGKWSELVEDVKDRTLESGVYPTEYSYYKVYQIEDEGEGIVGAGLMIYGYDYHGPVYNVYGEIETDKEVTFTGHIETITKWLADHSDDADGGDVEDVDDAKDGDDAYSDDPDSDDADAGKTIDEKIRDSIANNDVKLYQKIDGEYVEITPPDIRIASEKDEYGINVVVTTSMFENMEGGTYKIAIGDLVDEFKVEIKWDEAW